jgi:hypothetical protein
MLNCMSLNDRAITSIVFVCKYAFCFRFCFYLCWELCTLTRLFRVTTPEWECATEQVSFNTPINIGSKNIKKAN